MTLRGVPDDEVPQPPTVIEKVHDVVASAVVSFQGRIKNSRCKTCQSAYERAVENAHFEDRRSVEDIHEEFVKLDPTLSVDSLYRHMRNHAPRYQRRKATALAIVHADQAKTGSEFVSEEAVLQVIAQLGVQGLEDGSITLSASDIIGAINMKMKLEERNQVTDERARWRRLLGSVSKAMTEVMTPAMQEEYMRVLYKDPEVISFLEEQKREGAIPMSEAERRRLNAPDGEAAEAS